MAPGNPLWSLDQRSLARIVRAQPNKGSTMGEYVAAIDIRPGDYVSSLGYGYIDRKVTDIVGIHSRGKSGNDPWEDRRCLSIHMGTGQGAMGHQAWPDSMLWRSYKRPTESPCGDDGSVTVNGLIVGRIELKADESCWEYLQQHAKREIIGGPTGYVWVGTGTDGKSFGKSLSYAKLLESVTHIALMYQDRSEFV